MLTSLKKHLRDSNDTLRSEFVIEILHSRKEVNLVNYSPLRYPGGKGKISTFFVELFEKNNLIGGTYEINNRNY